MAFARQQRSAHFVGRFVEHTLAECKMSVFRPQINLLVAACLVLVQTSDAVGVGSAVPLDSREGANKRLVNVRLVTSGTSAKTLDALRTFTADSMGLRNTNLRTVTDSIDASGTRHTK